MADPRFKPPLSSEFARPAVKPIPFRALTDALIFLPNRRPGGEHSDRWAT